MLDIHKLPVFLSDDNSLLNCTDKIAWNNGMQFLKHKVALVARISYRIPSIVAHTVLVKYSLQMDLGSTIDSIQKIQLN